MKTHCVDCGGRLSDERIEAVDLGKLNPVHDDCQYHNE